MLIIPRMERIDETASQQTRVEAFNRYCEKLVELNKRFFLPLGVKRRWWHIRIEHPLSAIITTNES